MNGSPWWVTLARFTGIGWYIGVAIVAPTLGGAWLDGKAGTAPLFVLLGLFLGLSTAFYGTYRMTVSYLSGPQRSDSDEQKGPES